MGAGTVNAWLQVRGHLNVDEPPFEITGGKGNSANSC